MVADTASGQNLLSFLLSWHKSVGERARPHIQNNLVMGSLIPLTYCRGAASATDLTASNRCKSSGFGIGLLKNSLPYLTLYSESELAPYEEIPRR